MNIFPFFINVFFHAAMKLEISHKIFIVLQQMRELASREWRKYEFLLATLLNERLSVKWLFSTRVYFILESNLSRMKSIKKFSFLLVLFFICVFVECSCLWYSRWWRIWIWKIIGDLVWNIPATENDFLERNSKQLSKRKKIMNSFIKIKFS